MKTRFMRFLFIRSLLSALMVSTVLCATLETISAAPHVAFSRGISEPPFLSYGIKSNLLLLLDNSGSMLDMAYAGSDGQCFDDEYLRDPKSAITPAPVDPSLEYTGYFKRDSWYVWQDASSNVWNKNTPYTNGALVIDNGVFYKASCTNTDDLPCTSSSTATNIGEDNAINWVPATNVTPWVAGKTYAAASFIKHKSQLYFLFSPATGTYASITDPATDTAHWQPVNYTWRQNIGYSTGDIVTYKGMVYRAPTGVSAKSIFDYSDWQRLDEGHFQEVPAAPCSAPSYEHNYTIGSNTIADLQITMVDDGGTKITNVSTQNPASVTCFAARGNFLNWASASKFDIQKKILTGGKFYAGYENPDNAITTDTVDDRLIGEHRGCAGTGFVKQINVSNGTNNHLLTLRVRGAMGDNPWIVQTDDRVDTTDNTTRIEVLAVSVSGFNVSECIAAAEELTNGGSGATAKQEIDGCLNYSGFLSGTENSTNVNSLIECTQYWAGNSLNVSNLESHCENIYNGGTLPSTITPWDPEFICYGVYNPNISTVAEREGYFGACWGLNSINGECTDPATCSYSGDITPSGTGLTQRCVGGIEFQCPASATYRIYKDNYICEEKNNKDDGWIPLYKNNSGYCDYDGELTSADTDWVNNPAECTRLAADKFCGQLQVPEVIDPSDKLTTTTDTYNLPAMLIDAGVMGQLNTRRPLAVLKGYIKQTEKPEGVLQATTEELRIGAMAFNSVGSATEGGTNPYIERFSPPDNKDGASVISEIKLGSMITDDNDTPIDNTDDRTHVNDLAEAINDVRATSWTPLAEAMYNAIGYFTQNDTMRLNTDDFLIGIQNDPVTNWCQSNNILIITEGASTADINQKVVDFVSGASIVSDGDSEVGTCAGGLAGSTYLDDLTYHAQNASASKLYPIGNSQLQTLDGDWKDKQNISTYIVASGGLRGSITDTSECTAARLINDAATNGGTSLYDSASPKELEQDLLEIFNALRQRASSGSAASVISSSRGGEGAIYQAIFWPEISRKDYLDKEYSIAWTGDVHALFVDSRGYMYEDTDGDHAMTPTEDTNDNGVLDDGEDTNPDGVDGVLDIGDKRVIIYFDELSGKSMGCYNTANWIGTCPDPPVDIENVKFLWSATEWLSEVDDLVISDNRFPYLSNTKQRYIYTWNDLNNDGIVDHAKEWIPFTAATNWSGLDVSSATIPRNTVPVDFDVATSDVAPLPAVLDAKVDDIVNWIRGKDRVDPVDFNGNLFLKDDGEAPLRSRTIPPTEGSFLEPITARLGDIIHSTPMTVSSPAEGFHLIYNDFSYAEFVKKYKQRRHVIYFGSNDGMLHAVNGGFYVEKQHKFCTSVLVDDVSGDCIDNPNHPELGAELWAYVPYNLLPHLSSLTNPDYKHKYFVDMRPRIFDAQIFAPGEDANGIDHVNGWGTILVGGMRLGGAPINALELNGATLQPDDVRQFISSYFIFDITDPEKPPVLLGELTRRNDGSGDTDLGHSVAIPTMVIMKKDKALPQTPDNQWYLLFGSGPHAPIGTNDAMKGISDQPAKVGVLPLDWLVKTPTALRIPIEPPNPGGTFVLNDSPNGFTSDLITVDHDINPSSTSYMADAVYFGTNEGNYALKSDGVTPYWAGGGRIYRLITRNTETSGEYLIGKTITQQITTPDDWSMTTLMNAGQPVSAALNVAWDGRNYWVYGGTGRFFDADDKTDDTQQSFYGIKEPMKATATSGVLEYLRNEVTAPTLHGTPTTRNWPVESEEPGQKGLLKVDEIRVAEASQPQYANLSCQDLGTDCIPQSMLDASKTKFSDLIHYIADPDPAGGDPDNLYNSTDGWYVDYYPYGNRERNLGQSTLFGGLVTFTTYQPFLDPCQAEGSSYLYALYYKTGTAWSKKIFGTHGLYDNERDVREKLDLGRGLSTTPNLHVSGDGNSVTAMVQTSTGVIVEQKQDEMATDDYFTGRTGWKECNQ